MSDGRFVTCNWCLRPRSCQEAMGYSPSCGYVIAGFSCDPCRGRFHLSFIRDPGVKGEPPMIHVMRGNLPVFA